MTILPKTHIRLGTSLSFVNKSTYCEHITWNLARREAKRWWDQISGWDGEILLLARPPFWEAIFFRDPYMCALENLRNHTAVTTRHDRTKSTTKPVHRNFKNNRLAAKYLWASAPIFKSRDTYRVVSDRIVLVDCWIARRICDCDITHYSSLIITCAAWKLLNLRPSA